MRRQGLVDIAQESWTLLLVEASADDASQSPPVAAACGALYRVMTDSSLPGNHRYKPCFSSYGCLTEVSPRVKTQTPRSVTMWQKLRCSRLNTPPILCTTFAVMRELLTSACEFPLELRAAASHDQGQEAPHGGGGEFRGSSAMLFLLCVVGALLMSWLPKLGHFTSRDFMTSSRL